MPHLRRLREARVPAERGLTFKLGEQVEGLLILANSEEGRRARPKRPRWPPHSYRLADKRRTTDTSASTSSQVL